MVIQREILQKLSYDEICHQKYMRGFDRLVFIKAYVNYEGNTKLLLRNLQDHIGEKLLEYRQSVAEFLEHIDNEIKNLPLFPVRYLHTKLNVLLRRVYKNMDNPDFILPLKEVDPKYQSLKVSLEDIEAQLEIEELTLAYLGDAKDQLKNHWGDKDFIEATNPFVEKLPKALVNIIEYLIIHYRPESLTPEIEYLINFFNVFGNLIEVNSYHQMILEFMTKHLKTDKPTFQHNEHPQMFRTPKIFDIDGLDFSPYGDIIKADKLFYNPNLKLYEVTAALKMINPAYIYHPEWIKFFNYDPKTQPVKINRPEERQKVIEDGFKNIYYVYVHARKENLLPLDPNVEKEKIADELYNFIISNKCYANKKNPCEMEKLIPSQVFAKNYIVMLTLLKPFTSNPTSYDEEDIKNIVDISIKLGIVDLHKNVENLDIDVPEFKKKVAIEKINNFEDSLKDLTKPIIQANKDQDDFYKKRLVAQTIDANFDKIKENFEKIYPEIQEVPETQEDFEKYVDTLEVIVDKVFEEDNETAKVLMKIIEKKIDETNIDNLSETDPLLDRITEILDKVTDLGLKKIWKNPAVHPENPFLRYLDYTITKKVIEKKNNKPDYFTSNLHNEIRKRDLYVFYYRVKLMELINNEADDTEIKEFKDRFEGYEDVLVDDYDGDEFFSNFSYSFEFMIPFFNLFSLFESTHEMKGEKNISRDSDFVTIFDKLYKFLIDVRVNLEFREEHPLKFAYQKLLGCMTEVKNNILYGTKLSDSTYELSEDELQLMEEEQIRIKLDHRPCKQNYSTMSTYYYFLLVEASDHHSEILPMHTAYFKHLFAIRLDVLYKYLEKSNNWFEESFIRYCNRSEDSICLGDELYRKITEFMQGAPSRKDVEELLSEKVMTLSRMTKHGNNVPPSLFWEVMGTVAKSLTSMGRNQESNRQVLKTRKLTLGAEEEGQESEYFINSISNQHRDIFNKYIALRYHRMSNLKSDSVRRVYAAVDYLITGTHDIFTELEDNKNLPIATCKFLLFYSTTFEHVVKIADAMLKLEFLEDFLLWDDNKPVLKSDDFLKIASETEPENGAKQIALYFKFKSYTPKVTAIAPKTTTATKKPATTANTKNVLLARKGGARKPVVKKTEEKVDQEEQPVVGDTSELLEIVETEELEKQLKQTMKDAGVKSLIIVTKGQSSDAEVLTNEILKMEAKKHLRVRRMRLLRRVLV